MQKVAASVFAFAALQGCGGGDDKPKTSEVSVRGSGNVAKSSYPSYNDVAALEAKAKSKAAQYVKTANLNATIGMITNFLKDNKVDAKELDQHTNDIKTLAQKAQHELLKEGKNIQQLAPDLQAKAVKLLGDAKGADLTKMIQENTAMFTDEYVQEEAAKMVAGFDVLNVDQKHAFNNAIKSATQQFHQTFGNNPLTSKYVNNLATSFDKTKGDYVSQIEKVAVKEVGEKMMAYEKSLYGKIPYDKIQNSATKVKNGLSERNATEELKKAQAQLVKYLQK